MRRCWVFLFLFLIGCDDVKKEGINEMKNKVIDIKVVLGTPIETLLKNSPLKFSTDCLPAVSMCWYEVRPGGKNQALIDVSIDTPEGTLSIKNTVSLNIVVDELETKNIENLSVTLRGLPDNSSHDENKEIIYALISNLKNAGWKKYYYPAAPRISGSELSRFEVSGGVFDETPISHPLFDVNYKMSSPEWLAVNIFYDWYMYSGDYIAHIKVQKRNSIADPSQTGVYLINVNFMSLEYFWRVDFDEAIRPRWKDFFSDRLHQLMSRRLKVEERAKAAGMLIDDTYQPPRMERVN